MSLRTGYICVMITDFTNHIGRTVWRTSSMCNCDVCRDVFEDGLFILDANHATYIKDVAAETGLKYFQTKEERDQWINHNSNLFVTKQ